MITIACKKHAVALLKRQYSLSDMMWRYSHALFTYVVYEEQEGWLLEQSIKSLNTELHKLEIALSVA